MPKRILIRSHGPDEKTAIKALAAALKEAQSNAVNTIHLFVPAKSAFSGSVVAKAIGDPATNQLLAGKSVLIKDGISLKLESPETLRHSTSVRIALATYLDAKGLRAVDGLSHLNCIVFLPWISDEGEGWQQSWNAEVLGEKVPERSLNLHPQLEQKLGALTNTINLSTGLSHPSDTAGAASSAKCILYSTKTITRSGHGRCERFSRHIKAWNRALLH
jgi:hypothetical protein